MGAWRASYQLAVWGSKGHFLSDEILTCVELLYMKDAENAGIYSKIT